MYCFSYYSGHTIADKKIKTSEEGIVTKKIEVNYFLLTLWKLSLFQSNGCLKIYFN